MAMLHSDSTLRAAARGTAAPRLRPSDAEALPDAAPLGQALWLRSISGWVSDAFLVGLHQLAIAHGRTPSLPDLNQRLLRLGGWQLKPAVGAPSLAAYAEAFREHTYPLFASPVFAMSQAQEVFCVAPMLANAPFTGFLTALGRALPQRQEATASAVVARLLRHMAHFGVVREGNEPRAFGSHLLAGHLGKTPLEQAWLVPFSAESLLATPTPGEDPRAEPSLFVVEDLAELPHTVQATLRLL